MQSVTCTDLSILNTSTTNRVYLQETELKTF